MRTDVVTMPRLRQFCSCDYPEDWLHAASGHPPVVEKAEALPGYEIEPVPVDNRGASVACEGDMPVMDGPFGFTLTRHDARATKTKVLQFAFRPVRKFPIRVWNMLMLAMQRTRW